MRWSPRQTGPPARQLLDEIISRSRSLAFTSADSSISPRWQYPAGPAAQARLDALRAASGYDWASVLIRMRDEGLVAAVGVGMNQWQAPLRMVRETGIDLVMLAGRWTLLDRSGQPLLDECVARGVAVVAAAPFNSGLLARAWPPDGAHFDYGPAAPEVLARARVLAAVCERHGVSLPDAAIQFPLRHPAVVSVVSGMRSGEQVASTLDRFATVVPDEVWTELDAC